MYEVGLHLETRGSTIHWQVLNGCWLAPGMEVINVKIYCDILTCLLGSFLKLYYKDSGPRGRPIQLCLQNFKPNFCLKHSLGVQELS